MGKRFQLDKSDIPGLKNLTIDCELGRFGVEVHNVWIHTPALDIDQLNITEKVSSKALLALTKDAQEWYDANEHLIASAMLEDEGMSKAKEPA